MLDAGGPVIFSSVGIKRRFVFFWGRLGHHSSKLQGQSCVADSCACPCCTQPIRLVQGHAASGQDVKYSNTDIAARGGHINTNRRVHGWRAAPVHIRHVVIFYSMSNTRLNTRVIGLVCKTAVLTSGECSMLCVLLSSAFHNKRISFHEGNSHFP